MSYIADYIHKKNSNDEKVLSVFLTSGFPDKINFSDLALKILDSGADLLEIGFPFSDPLADGPVIQQSSQTALKNGINLVKTFEYVKRIREKTEKPLILMGYANPVLNYGIESFLSDSEASGVNGIIIPDIPIDEYDNFFTASSENIDTILLAAPTTTDEKLKLIDEMSRGFVYCVSIKGTTGTKNQNVNESINFLKRTKTIIRKNKTLVGFGVSNPADVKKYSSYCDGVIVGSAIIKSLMNENNNYSNTLDLIKELKSALTDN